MRIESLLVVCMLIVVSTCAARRARCESSGPSAWAQETVETRLGRGADRHTPIRRAASEPLAVRNELVRTWLAEARWSARDHLAIAFVLQRWSKRMGWSLPVAIDLRVKRFSRRPPRWVRALEPSCVQPAGWPRHLSWGAHTDLCFALYARADAFLAGEESDPCGGRARGWRAPGAPFLEALELGRRPVWCGKTSNRFVR